MRKDKSIKDRRSFLKAGSQSLGFALLAGSPAKLWASEGAESSRKSSSQVHINTVTVGPGINRAAIINAALAAGDTVMLQEGTYTLETAIVVPSGGKLLGAGSALTKLTPGWTPSSSLADTATNALIKVQGTITGTVNTTLSASAPKNSAQIVVASAAGITANQWLVVAGPNQGADDTYTRSDTSNVIKTELVKVASTYVSGTTVALGFRTYQHHASAAPASTVKSVNPCLNVVLQGFDLTCDGNNFAVGILTEYTSGLRIQDVRGAGFSRAMVNCQLGTREFDIDVYGRGENNSIVYLDSSISGSVQVNSSAEGKRFHALGYPRGGVVFRQRVTSVRVSGTLQNLCTGLSIWGGHNNVIENIMIRKCDVTERINRAIPNVDGIRLPSGLDVNVFWSTSYGEWSYGLTIGTLTCEDCLVASDTGQSTVCLVDTVGFSAETISILNTTGVYSGPGNYMSGLEIIDAYNGHIGTLNAKGVHYALRTQNFGANNYVIDYMNVAYGYFNVYLNHTQAFGTPRIKSFSETNCLGIFCFGSSFANDPNGVIDHAFLDGNWYTHCTMAYNNTGTAFSRGDVVMLDSTSPGVFPYVKAPTGPNAVNAVMVSGLSYGDPGTGYAWITALPTEEASVKATFPAGGVINVGDLLQATNASRAAVVNNAAANKLQLLGVALEKRTGVAGTVTSTPIRVGRV